MCVIVRVIIKTAQSSNVTGQLKVLQHRSHLSNVDAPAPAPRILFFFLVRYVTKVDPKPLQRTETRLKSCAAVHQTDIQTTLSCRGPQ